MRKLLVFKFLFLFLICSSTAVLAQGHDGHNHGSAADDSHDQSTHQTTDDHSSDGAHESHGGHHSSICGEEVDQEFNVGETALHHISDANVYTIGPLHIPLPVFLYAKGEGMSFFSTKKFQGDLLAHHADGKVAYKRYVLHGGTIKRVLAGQHFPAGDEVTVNGFITRTEFDDAGKKKDVTYVCAGSSAKDLYKLENRSTADFGLFGGGMTSFIDFSPTKNVIAMILVLLFLSFIFLKTAKAYKKRDGKEPKGLQSFMETFVVFIRDEVAIPFLGEHKWEKYFNFLMAIFFFILGLNLFGQIPFFGGANVSGNLAVTAVLAILAFIVTNVSGNGHYWKHIFLAPGVPLFVKVILVPVEIMGIFIKPVTLMLRLFANIAAGHIVLVVFAGLIFIFGQSGANVGAGYATGIGSVLLSLFMMAIELIVALVQAFVFTLLTASYIGAATEEAH